MRKIAYGILVLIAIGTLYGGVKHVLERIEIGPAKRAVLEIKADLDRAPVDATAAVSAPETQPNIIIIMADDLGWRDVSYNQSEIQTPVMDRLAREGITLNRFYVQPSCSPTRAALMTGKSPMRLGIINPITKNNPTGLPLSEVTIADRLRGVGYQTALIGKWHLGARNLAYHPNERGFDYFYGNVTGGVSFFNKTHGGGYDWQRNGRTVREEGYTTHLLAEEAIAQIESRDRERPLFMFVSFGAPHLPNEAPEETIQAYRKIGNQNRRVHAAMVSELDTAIGEIHAALVANDIADETLIWFMSDNGGLIVDNPARFIPDPFFTNLVESHLGVETNKAMIEFTRYNLSNGGSDNRPFRKGKGSVYEGGVRVPSFMYWPSELAPNSYNYMTTVQDVVPTLMTLAGAADDTTFDGRDLFAALKTNRPAPAKDYITRIDVLADSTAIYRYPFKLLQVNDKVELFEIEQDPLETRNIADSNPDLVRNLLAAIQAFPRGESIAIPTQDAVNDVDTFGGEEDREPWAEQAYWQD